MPSSPPSPPHHHHHHHHHHCLCFDFALHHQLQHNNQKKANHHFDIVASLQLLDNSNRPSIEIQFDRILNHNLLNLCKSNLRLRQSYHHKLDHQQQRDCNLSKQCYTLFAFLFLTNTLSLIF